MTTENKNKPYALVTHQSLTIKKFDSKEDWQTAMNAVQSRGQEFTAFKYHNGAETYVKLDRWD